MFIEPAGGVSTGEAGGGVTGAAGTVVVLPLELLLLLLLLDMESVVVVLCVLLPHDVTIAPVNNARMLSLINFIVYVLRFPVTAQNLCPAAVAYSAVGVVCDLLC